MMDTEVGLNGYNVSGKEQRNHKLVTTLRWMLNLPRTKKPSLATQPNSPVEMSIWECRLPSKGFENEQELMIGQWNDVSYSCLNVIVGCSKGGCIGRQDKMIAYLMDANQEYEVSPCLSKIKVERLRGKLVPLPFLASKERLLHHFLFAGQLFSSSPARSRWTLICLLKQRILQFLSDSTSVLSPYWLSKKLLWLWWAQYDPEKHIKQVSLI